MKEKTPKAIHINELRRALDISRIDRTPVDLDCWEGSRRLHHPVPGLAGEEQFLAAGNPQPLQSGESPDTQGEGYLHLQIQ